MNDLVSQILTVVGPVVAAFVVGHFHVLIKSPVTPTPATPATPAAPAVPVIRPIGQGGIVDMLGILFSAVMTSPALSNATKASVSNQLVQVQDALTAAQAAPTAK